MHRMDTRLNAFTCIRTSEGSGVSSKAKKQPLI